MSHQIGGVVHHGPLAICQTEFLSLSIYRLPGRTFLVGFLARSFAAGSELVLNQRHPNFVASVPYFLLTQPGCFIDQFGSVKRLTSRIVMRLRCRRPSWRFLSSLAPKRFRTSRFGRRLLVSTTHSQRLVARSLRANSRRRSRRAFCSTGSATGADICSFCVYGCSGRSETCSVAPTSTISPLSITAIR